MNLTHIIENQKERFENSELLKRINSVESIAYVHGVGDYKGQTIQQWHSQDIKEILEAVVELVGPNVAETGELFQVAINEDRDRIRTPLLAVIEKLK